jgi:hypothetical protein
VDHVPRVHVPSGESQMNHLRSAPRQPHARTDAQAQNMPQQHPYPHRVSHPPPHDHYHRDANRNAALGCAVLCIESSAPEEEDENIDALMSVSWAMLRQPRACSATPSRAHRIKLLSNSGSSCKFARLALVPHSARATAAWVRRHWRGLSRATNVRSA